VVRFEESVSDDRASIWHALTICRQCWQDRREFPAVSAPASTTNSNLPAVSANGKPVEEAVFASIETTAQFPPGGTNETTIPLTRRPGWARLESDELRILCCQRLNGTSQAAML